jgi:hypothetical protein
MSNLQITIVSRYSLVKLIVLASLVAPSVIAQSQQKSIEWSSTPINSHVRTAPDTHAFDQLDGIEIEGITENGQSIIIGQPFAAGDDWLDGIVFRVKNVSGQRLSAIQIDLVLPEMTHTVDIPFIYGTPTEKEKGILPGAEVELRVPPGIYAWAKDRITETGSLSRISRAEIREMLVSLPNDTKWFSGCVKTTNPKNACHVASP